jgi:MoaA/NifB/PqqE/SkfB family radical SAM enzyme
MLRKNRESPKILKGLSLYLEKIEGVKLGESLIDFLMINSPPICNYHCKKCFTLAYAPSSTKDALKLTEIFPIIKESRKLGARVLCILGEGEPLLWKNIKRIISYAHQLGMISLIATNGSLLTKKMTDFLFSHDTTIVVSIDTLNGRKYNDFTGASLSKVLENLSYARKKYSHGIDWKNGYKIYRLAINMTLTAENLNDALSIMEFCKDDIYFSCFPLAKVGMAKLYPSLSGNKKTYKNIRKLSRILNKPMVLAKTEQNDDVCCLYYYGLGIGYEGEILFDTHALQTKHTIGNIRKLPLIEAIKRVKKLKKLFSEKFSTGYFCPVRDDNYEKFLEFLKTSFS